MSDDLIARADAPAPAPIESDFARVLEKAIDAGVTGEQLAKLVEVKFQLEESEARKQFNRAITAFQRACPQIGKVATADTGKYVYDYAPLEHIAQVIAPHLAANGLSYRFDSEIGPNGEMVSICHVRHVDGYSESSRFAAALDNQARMNATQKYASALSYTRRYALMLALGLVAGGEDDDAQALNRPPKERQSNATVQPRGQRVAAAWIQSVLAEYKRKFPKQGSDSERREALAAWLNETCQSSATIFSKANVLTAETWTLADLHCACDELGIPYPDEVTPEY